MVAGGGVVVVVVVEVVVGSSLQGVAVVEMEIPNGESKPDPS